MFQSKYRSRLAMLMSIVLTLVMTVTMIPGTVFAAQNEEDSAGSSEEPVLEV